MGDLNKLAKAASEVNGGLGVYAMASTLGSLEALLEFLKVRKHASNCTKESASRSVHCTPCSHF